MKSGWGEKVGEWGFGNHAACSIVHAESRPLLNPALESPETPTHRCSIGVQLSLFSGPLGMKYGSAYHMEVNHDSAKLRDEPASFPEMYEG
jgi:hypothetical protein